MYGIDSGNGYVYGEDPAVEKMEKKQGQEQEQEEKAVVEMSFSTMVKINFINI